MILQKNDISCGPVSLMNAYFHKHNKYPKITMTRLSVQCIIDQDYGTRRYNMKNNQIIKLNKPIYNKKIISTLKNFILLYSFDVNAEFGAHYVFVQKDKRCGIYNIYNFYHYNNEYSNKDYDHITIGEKEFKKLLTNNPRDDEGLIYPLAWNIT